MPEQETVLVRGEGGSIFEMDYPIRHPGIAGRIAAGGCQIVDSKGVKAAPPDSDGAPKAPRSASTEIHDARATLTRPNNSAPKEAWVEWGTAANGGDRALAEALSKADLIDMFGDWRPDGSDA